MSDKRYALLMARYNRWQNDTLIAAADTLSEAERERDRGAFFGSIRETLAHILWGDSTWMSKFTDYPAPTLSIEDSRHFATGWTDYKDRRAALDRTILEWVHGVSPDWFDGDLTWYSVTQGRRIGKPKSVLIVQFFNHQTHHRGQVHAMLTAAGATPGPTDVPFLPDAYATA